MSILGPIRGTVTLVALCFTTVLGISLAGYITVCSRTMQLSNRSFQGGLSRQLAELGLEEGMRAFNKNLLSGTDTTAALADWSTGGVTSDWTLDTTNKRATATITFPAAKFGQGVTGSVKIRVDNYDAGQLGSTWSSSATYRINDLVGRNSIWYRSVRNNNTNQTPSTTNLTWWVRNPMPWTWSSDTTYSQYQMVNYKGIWYRCITTPLVSAGTTTYAPQVPLPATTYWTPIPTLRAWSSGVAYEVYDVVANTDATTGHITLYRCTTAHTSSASFSTDAANWTSTVQTVSLAWSSGTVYTRGAMVYYIGASVYRWYYCIQSGTSSTIPSTDTTMWAPVFADTAAAAPTSGSTSYVVGNIVNYSGDSYRCTVAHTYTPPAWIPGNWSLLVTADTLVGSTRYYPGDYACYGDTWYLCTTAHTYNNWASDSGNWTSTNAKPYLQLFYRGSNNMTYSSNHIIYYAGSTWYRYMGGWNVALTGSMHVWTSGYKYNPEDAVYYSTTARWYRCLVAHTSSGSIVPTTTAYWATDPSYSTSWDSGRQYSQYDTVRYNGVWYLSLQNSNTNQNPSTATTWWIGANTGTASYQWSNATAYSAGSYKCHGGVWYKCISATTANAGHSPNHTTYWTASWANSWGVTTGAPVVYAEGTVTIEGSPSVKTQLRATIAPAPLFPNAAAANSSTLTANSGGTVDSYDSTVGTYASQTSSATTNHSAVLASGYSAGTAITLSSTDVKGYLAAPSSSSSPYAPLYSSGGTVKGFTSPVSPNIDLTRISRSPFIPKFDTIPDGAGGLAAAFTASNFPKGTALSLPGTSTGTASIGAAGDTVPSRYYYNGTLTIGGASIQYLNINGPVILYINGDLFITNSSGNNGRINLSSTGSAEIHVTGAFKADAGGEGILSYNTDPKSLIIISDTTGTATQFYSEGVNPLYGTVYMPYSTGATGYYNDNTNTNVYGAISANKITYSGANLNLHYDTSLRYATFGGVDQPYAISEWRELTDAAELATMP